MRVCYEFRVVAVVATTAQHTQSDLYRDLGAEASSTLRATWVRLYGDGVWSFIVRRCRGHGLVIENMQKLVER